MSDIRHLVTAYYPRIDAVDIDWVMALFAPGASYQRADVRYDGIAAIDHFFRVERQIRGTHVIDRLWCDEATRTVFATGVFEGHGVAGDARRAGFADIWRFDTDNHVTDRQTYLALGHAYVER